LRPYQQEVVTQLYERDFTLATLPVGAGKTLSTLTAIEELLRDGVLTRVLVVAPLRVANHVWAQEAAKFGIDLELAVATGTPLRRRQALESDADVVVINFENLRWLIERPEFASFDGLVWDEVSKMKAVSSKRFKAVRNQLRQFKWIVGLTGTLIAVGIQDLFGQAVVIDRGKTLGRTITGFRQAYMMNTAPPGAHYAKWEPQAGARDRVLEALEPLVVSIPPEVYSAQLPDEVVVRVETDLDMPGVYRELEEELMTELDGEVIESHAAQKLQQACQGFLYDMGKVPHWFPTQNKLDALEELVGGEPVLLFYQYQAERDAIIERFGAEDLDVDSWNRGEQPIALAHPLSAGHGLNLQAGGNHIVWMAPPWSLELWLQANGRLRRGGQQAAAVFIHVLCARDSIEDRVLAALEQRQELDAAIRDHFA
jgi:SNF2 family DNA or RNA helicase